MKILGPTRHSRLNEVAAILFLVAGLFYVLSLVSYHPQDASLNTVTSAIKPQNLIGPFGAHISDLSLQLLGMGAFAFPVLLLGLAWKWLRSEAIDAQGVKLLGAASLVLGLCTAFSFVPDWRPFGGAVTMGGVMGLLLADFLISLFNITGAIIFTGAVLILSLYLVSTFHVGLLAKWFSGPIALFGRIWARFRGWRDRRRHMKQEQARLSKQELRAAKEAAKLERRAARTAPQADPVQEQWAAEVTPDEDAPPFEIPIRPHPAIAETPAPSMLEDIPIKALEEWEAKKPAPVAQPVAEPESVTQRMPDRRPNRKPIASYFQLPSTELLKEPNGRASYDSQELKDIAARIKAKFEEFNVLGSVVQINPGPVVTTFEFKPEAGVKYSRITALTEDLCLGLQAESILIERIPGKPTVGIEVPNSNREVISLREILESEEFANSSSPLTISLGKDISGRIKVSALETMPHLLIAGSTGSGKSVMLNTMIMSLLYKATPKELRMIMIDPKRVELGIYEGIPHLLVPVITEARKATNALRNAVLEMERRLKLLAAQGVRNIDQYNKKVKQVQQKPRTLFEEDEPVEEELLEPLPYILILIDELADLMMLERANVEESVTRLAQMARAVGMHLVLATQRPSVDVITGLIKANFPARISFRVATRVDSRTILDVMGSEHLLGKGDMLLLPPGSARLTRVHGAYVSEAEINSVVDFWKNQAKPEYDPTFLIAPPSEDEADAEADEFDGEEDPMYQDAVRVVLEMGKASTSTLQRRLRLGYGRAARILDMMQREGIIGPPDGSRPREVLKRPDWLEEVEQQLR